MKTVALAVFALALSNSALAADEVAKPAKPVKICKPDRNSTGTRIPKRTCKTKEQWEMLEGVQDLETRSRGGAIQARFGVERAGPGGR